MEYFYSTPLGDNDSFTYDCFYGYDNITYYYDCYGDYEIPRNTTVISVRIPITLYVMNCIIIGISLPLTLVAIYALYSMVRKDDVAPIYVINLLISDLVQLCCMGVQVKDIGRIYMTGIIFYIYFCGLMASVCFMVCVALERYLVIAWPLWYRCRRTIKTSVVVCIMVWIIPPLYILPFYAIDNILFSEKIYAVFALPLPLFIFFLVGTLKALSAAISVTSDEKRQITGTLVVVLLIYTLLFVPSLIRFLVGSKAHVIIVDVSLVFLHLNPLADLILYIFMRKGMIDKLLASVCCCRMDSNDISTSSV